MKQIVKYHHLKILDVLNQLQANQYGLTTPEATNRLQKYGLNALETKKPKSVLRRIFDQINNILIWVLLASAVITGLLGHYIDTFVIFGVVLINAVIGYLQEGKAQEALDAIGRMLSVKATVWRDHAKKVIDSTLLVPGDIVTLAAGDKIAADIRIMTAEQCMIDESALTGESMPVVKTHRECHENAPLAERYNMAYMGTMVTSGEASGVVVRTGAQTEFGRIGKMMNEVGSVTTPLLRQLTRFGQWLTIAILALCALTFIFGVFVRHYSLADMFLMCVALAVSAIPEGLPVVMTITLAVGVMQMAKLNAIVRRLPAVEALGSVTIICSDKTGTLTQNEMTVKNVITSDATFDVSGNGLHDIGELFLNGETIRRQDYKSLDLVLKTAIYCNDASVHYAQGRWNAVGDPTETALLMLARKAKIDTNDLHYQNSRIAAVPFDFETRMMATLNETEDGRCVFVKGAPEVILQKCKLEQCQTSQEPLNRSYWEEKIQSLAVQGQRTLALAYRRVSAEQRYMNDLVASQSFVMLGLVSMIDPPRLESAPSVAYCRQAGIVVKMITGDHPDTARAIAQSIGIDNTQSVVIGSDIENADDKTLQQLAQQSCVFARTSPEHKLRLVQALQASGEIVAMTGDGINDAPALKRADVGVAMGKNGTDAAREVSSVVLADDNFATIAKAVQEGRRIYDNLQKGILFLLPTNGAMTFVVILAILFGVALPLTSKQILWINMVTATTLALSLAFEQSESSVMNRPPRRPSEPPFTLYMTWRVIATSVVQLVVAWIVFFYVLNTSHSLAQAQTATATMIVVGQIAYLLNCRFLRTSSMSLQALTGNRVMLIAIVVLMAIQGIYIYCSFMHQLFDTAKFAYFDWVMIIILGIVSFWLVELDKFVERRITKRTKLLS